MKQRLDVKLDFITALSPLELASRVTLLIIVTGIFLFISSGWTDVILEAFEDENLDDWQEVTHQNLKVNASWEVIDGELHGFNHNPLIRLLTTTDEAWQDYSIEFEVKPLIKVGSGSILIIARMRGNQAVMCMVGDMFFPELGSNATCMYGDLQQSFFQIHKELPHKFLPLNRWSTLKLSVDGDMLAFWVNGKQVLEPIVLDLEPTEKFAGFAMGRAGLGLENYTARFDNVRIAGNDISLPVTGRMKVATTWAKLKGF